MDKYKETKLVPVQLIFQNGWHSLNSTICLVNCSHNSNSSGIARPALKSQREGQSRQIVNYLKLIPQARQNRRMHRSSRTLSFCVLLYHLKTSLFVNKTFSMPLSYDIFKVA